MSILMQADRMRRGVCAALVLAVIATAAAGVEPARAQYPDVNKEEAPPPPAAAAPAGEVKPGADAAAAAKDAEPPLTEAEKAEREGRRACKADICAAFHNRKAGPDVACAVTKSFRKSQLDKMVSKAKVSWPWGPVVCKSDIKLSRDTLIKAMTEDRHEATLETHKVSCTVDREKAEKAEISFEFAPKVTFEKGKAVKAQLNWGKLEAPTLLKGVLWPATGTDNAVNVLGGMLVDDINDFIGPKCAEVKPDWEGR